MAFRATLIVQLVWTAFVAVLGPWSGFSLLDWIVGSGVIWSMWISVEVVRRAWLRSS